MDSWFVNRQVTVNGLKVFGWGNLAVGTQLIVFAKMLSHLTSKTLKDFKKTLTLALLHDFNFSKFGASLMSGTAQCGDSH